MSLFTVVVAGNDMWSIEFCQLLCCRNYNTIQLWLFNCKLNINKKDVLEYLKSCFTLDVEVSDPCSHGSKALICIYIKGGVALIFIVMQAYSS